MLSYSQEGRHLPLLGNVYSMAPHNTIINNNINQSMLKKVTADGVLRNVMLLGLFIWQFGI